VGQPAGHRSTRRLHRGLDIGLPIGTPILAVDRGVVTYVQSQDVGDAGIWTAVRHPSGITSRYIHLSRTLVKVGQAVQRGEQIGLSGDTATRGLPHLHLDLRAPAAMLPAIEAALGRPRSGWGPEMKPFGHSIPGEPLIPVDAYREIVRAEAAAMGLPLRDPSLPRNHGRRHSADRSPAIWRMQ
jgi:murein DD-endopeptidase MepM/ murein hydrolase activator NlpD